MNCEQWFDGKWFDGIFDVYWLDFWLFSLHCWTTAAVQCVRPFLVHLVPFVFWIFFWTELICLNPCHNWQTHCLEKKIVFWCFDAMIGMHLLLHWCWHEWNNCCWMLLSIHAKHHRPYHHQSTCSLNLVVIYQCRTFH